MPRPDDRARRIYIGNLPTDVREDDVKDKFKKYGHIEFIDLKSRGGGPPFAFMDFEDPR
jgi:arginine/serine-rich splicing factor 1/9